MKFREVNSLDENRIYSLTGCMSSCDKDELEITEASEIATKEKSRSLSSETVEFSRPVTDIPMVGATWVAPSETLDIARPVTDIPMVGTKPKPRPITDIPMMGNINANGRRKRCLALSPEHGGCLDQTDVPKRTLHLYMYYVNSRYDEKEQYVIYDLNSFIADVGGFMGLLLGFRIQSMLEMIEGYWKALTARKRMGERKESRRK